MALSQNDLKERVAIQAVSHILPMLDADAVVGVGTGSTADLFIDALSAHKHRFRAAVASSERSADRLQAHGIRVLDLNSVPTMPVYVDGADEVDPGLHMLKGGGGALTREKIVASVARQFVCIIDDTKLVATLGAFPLPIEVIPMALASVARRLRQLGGEPVERSGFITDNGGRILDVAGLSISAPAQFEATVNNIPGVISCGLFALAPADVVLVSGQEGVRTLVRDTNSLSDD